MFWDVFETMCLRVGKSPSAVAADLGLSNSVTTTWKNGSTPRLQTIQRIADYFNVSVEFLLGRESRPAQKESEAAQGELIHLFESVDPWVQEQVLSLLRAAESAKQAPDGEK